MKSHRPTSAIQNKLKVMVTMTPAMIAQIPASMVSGTLHWKFSNVACATLLSRWLDK